MSSLRKTYRTRSDEDERGVRVVLPRRPPRKPAAVVFGIVGTVFLGFSVAALGGTWFGEASRSTSLLASLGSSLFTLPFLVAGLGLWVGVFHAWNSRCTIELTPDELRVVEHVGRLRWTRRRAARDLQSLEVRERNEDRGTAGDVRWHIEARFASARRFDLAAGYPEAKLEEVAAHLREAALDWGEEVDERAPSPLVEGAPGAAPAGIDAAPIGGGIRVLEEDGGLVVDVPPGGVWRGSHGLFLLGLLFVTFVTLLAGFAVFAQPADAPVRDLVIGGLVVLLFFSVGAGMMAFGWSLGRRSARLVVDRGGLVVERRSPFGDRTERFARDAVEDVRAGPSGLTVNDVPVLEVQIFVGGEKALGLLSQRSDDECHALAARLRDALRD